MFGPFGACSKSCGIGQKFRFRQCIGGEAGEEGCIGSLVDSVDCNEQVRLMKTDNNS